MTRPVRVSKAARRLSAPARLYSCSTRTGRPAAAGGVGASRGRGWIEVFSSTESTISSGASGRVYSSQIPRTWSTNAPSRGALGLSHTCVRHGLSVWCSRIRGTVCARIAATTPLRTNSRAISAQSQVESERPRRSGRSHAILTTCRATTGGKNRRAAGARKIRQALDAFRDEALDPLACIVPLHFQLSRELRERHARGEPQDDLGPTHDGERSLGRPDNLFELRTLGRGQHDHE